MMIVDSHLHLFSKGYNSLRGSSPLGKQSDVAAYEALAARYRISAGLVVCYEAGGIDPHNNAYVRRLAATRTWIVSVAHVLVSPPPAPLDVASLLADGHIGIAVYTPDTAAAESLLNWSPAVWTTLEDARAIISFNAGPEAIAVLHSLPERAPGCTFLFAHLGLPGAFPSMPARAQARDRLAPLLRLASRPNVGVKISGLYAIDPMPPHLNARPFVDLVLEYFPSRQLHWGSDFSPSLEFVGLDQTLAISALDALTPGDRAEILGKSLMDRIKAR